MAAKLPRQRQVEKTVRFLVGAQKLVVGEQGDQRLLIGQPYPGLLLAQQLLRSCQRRPSTTSA